MQVDLGTTHYRKEPKLHLYSHWLLRLEITVCSSHGVEMAQGTRAQDAVVSVPPGQHSWRMPTLADCSWLVGDLVCFGSPTCETGRVWLWHDDSASHSWGEVVWELVSIGP